MQWLSEQGLHTYWQQPQSIQRYSNLVRVVVMRRLVFGAVLTYAGFGVSETQTARCHKSVVVARSIRISNPHCFLSLLRIGRGIIIRVSLYITIYVKKLWRRIILMIIRPVLRLEDRQLCILH